jgi:predicted transcriptional regulator
LTLEEIKRLLGCRVVVSPESLEDQVEAAISSDLMSDVLAFAEPGSVLITGLTNAQSVRTADVADIKAIIYVRGKQPATEAVQLADELGIPLMVSKLMMFEASGILFRNGLRQGGTRSPEDTGTGGGNRGRSRAESGSE